MKHGTTIKRFLSGLSVSLFALALPVASVGAAPAGSEAAQAAPTASRAQAAYVDPGTKDAKTMAPLGPTTQVNTDGKSAPKALPNSIRPLVGAVSNVDFQTGLNYCYRNLVYTPVYNSTAATKYLQVRVYNGSGYRDIYTSVAANSYVYPANYGVDGAWYAYLYVWNGSTYQYDEYMSGTNTCNVSVTRTYNTGGWVQLKIQNYGTAYATQVSTELAPYPGAGTYTGTQYDYPVAGGAALYRWFNVGTSPYGIVSSTYGSWNSPALFSGDL